MSTPTNHPSPAIPTTQYAYNPNQFMTSNPQQAPQQQYSYVPQQASSIPGASSGRGDPGPSSMSMAQNPQIRPNIPPAQMALLQQVTHAARGQGINLTPQQLHDAVSAIQAQGGLSNPAAVMNALRQASGQQQQLQQGMPGQGGQGMPVGQMGMNMGMPMGMGQMGQYPQQQMGQPNQYSGHPSQQPQQQQHRSQSSPHSSETTNYNHTNQQARLQQLMSHGSPSPSATASPRPHNTPWQGSMPPPAIPPGTPRGPSGPGLSGMPNQQMQQQQQQPQRYMLNAQQQQLITNQQSAMMANPQFQAMPPQQQQVQLATVQQRMTAMFASQAMAAQQQFGHPSQSGQPLPPPHMQQQQQPQQQQQQPQPPPPHQSPHISRQQTPVHAPSPQPMSSLPQHMAPPRPASAASRRAPSPHQAASPMAVSTPPANAPPYTPGPPQSAASPAQSVHSQHGQYQTPQPQQTPQYPQFTPHSASPHSGQQGTPGQSMRSATPIDMAGQMMQPTAPQFVRPPHHQQQQPQMGLQPGQPPPVIPPGNFTPQQQQQMANAMSVFSQAMGQNQNQSRPNPSLGGIGRPPPTQAQSQSQSQPQPGPASLPNSSDFPFDWRLLAHFGNLNNPQWRNEMSSKNPQLFNAVLQAQAMVHSGAIRTDVIQRMQQTLVASVRMANRPPPPNSIPGPPGSTTGPSPMGIQPGPGMVPPGQAIPGALGRPPLQASNETPGLLDRRSSAHREKQVAAQGGVDMPPPAWIPGQPPSTPARTPASSLPAPPPQVGPNQLPVKEWEGFIRPDLPITSITPLPVSTIDESADPTFGGILPSLSEREVSDIKTWMESDKAYVEVLADKGKRCQKKMINWAKNNDRDTPWWMVRKGERYQPPRTRLSILWPQDKAAMRAKTSHRGRREIRFTPTELKSMAQVEDHLIPIRLDIEHDQLRLKDTFTWNVTDTVVTPEMFAHSLCDDFGFPPNHFVPKIVAIIQERIAEYKDQIAPIEQVSMGVKGTQGKLDPEGPEGQAVIDVFRKAREEQWSAVTRLGSIGHGEGEGSIDSAPSVDLRTDPGDGADDEVKIVLDGEEGQVVENLGTEADVSIKKEQQEEHELRKEDDEGEEVDEEDDGERPMTVAEVTARLPSDSVEDLRFLIKIDIIVGTQNLSDTFEWDLNSEVTPEEFARLYCVELGLSGEFETALCHDIHEQIIVLKRSLFLVGHTFGSGVIPDDEVRSAFLPPLTQVLRKEDVAMSSFTPIFATFTEEDIVAIERERERDAKRKKRATRARRGIALPDRDPIKTHRTLLNPVGPNGTIAQTSDLALSTSAAPVQSSRRAAAIAAQANINLLAQDLPIPAPPSPVPAPAPTRGRGRGRGRGGGAGSRASPASFREGSVLNGSNGHHHVHGDYSSFAQMQAQTPVSSSLKRSLREDTASDIASPVPKKRQGAVNGRILSDDEGDGSAKVKAEPGDYSNLGTGRAGAGKIAKSQNSLMLATTSGDNTMPTSGLGTGGIGSGLTTPSSPASSALSVASKSKTRGTGPGKDTGFVPSSPSESGSDSSDSEGGSGRRKGGRGRPPQKQGQTGSVPPGPQRSVSGAIPPAWVTRAHADLSRKYPKDDFAVVQKPRPAGEVDGPQEWRMKCLDCPGRIYALGPGETLSNFEVHLKNRAHMSNVAARRGGK